MAKRKTQYTVNFYASPQEVNSLVVNWLNTNNFKYIEKDGLRYYRMGNPMVNTCWFFEYYIQGGQLTILAYLKSPKKPFPLDNGMVGILQTAPYVSKIEELTNLIARLDAQYVQPTYINQMQNQPQYMPQQNAGEQFYNNSPTYNNVQLYDTNGNPISNSISEENEKRNEKCAMWAFFLSIASLAAVFVGMIGMLVIFVTFCLANLGLKSKKSIFATLAIAITMLSLALGILSFMGLINISVLS